MALATLLTMVSITALLCGLVGILVKTWLIPYLEKALFTPLRETHNQVTVNHHTSETPTILDLLDDMQEDINYLRKKQDEHLQWHLDH